MENKIYFGGRSGGGKSNVLRNLVTLAVAKGRNITIGTSYPEQRYAEFRELCPEALMVIDDYGITILGKKS